MASRKGSLPRPSFATHFSPLAPFWYFGALYGALDCSVCRGLPVVPAALPMGWMGPAPQPGFLPLGITRVIACRLFGVNRWLL